MKKFFIILLIFILSINFLVCYASDDFDYGIDKSIDASFSNNIIVSDNTTGINKVTSTTVDFVPVFNKSILVPVKKMSLL